MKKFSKLNESNKKVETSTNKKDFISNLINETLKVKNGKIEGKEVLTEAINKILEINDSKTTIKVLETVRMASFRSFNLNWINEAIESEKKKMTKKDDDGCVDCDDDKKDKYKAKKGDDECVDCGDEEMVKENKFQIEVEVKVKPEEETILDEFEEPSEFDEDEDYEDEDSGVFVKESNVNDMKDIFSLMKVIGKINEEHHLTGKKERINFILANLGSKKVEKFVIDKISELPDYVKKADIEKTLRNLSDKEVEDLYHGVEDTIGVKESKVELIKEEHHLNTKKDQIDFIVANKENKKVKSYILNCLKNHPEFLKKGDVKETLKKLNADEIEEIYLGVEKEIGIK